MLDFADVVAINKFERRGAEDALRDVRRQLARNREAFDVARRAAGVRHRRRPLQRRRRHRAVPAPAHRLRRAWLGRRRACSRRSTTDVSTGSTVDRAAGAGALPGRDRRDGPRLPRRHRRAGRASPALPAAATPSATLLASRRRRRPTSRRSTSTTDDALGADDRELLDDWPRRSSYRRRARRRDRELRTRSRVAVGHAGAARVAAPLRRPRRAAALAARENLPGRFPFTAGVFPFKREGEDPARMFAGEGGPARTNRRFHLLRRGPARHPPVDRVRLGHALRLRPRRAPRHLRQGRQLGRVDRHARRHEGALRRASTCATRRRRCR